MKENLNINLDLLMTRDHLTANKVATQTGVPASTIKKIRSGVITNPTLATLTPLANFFSIPLEQMVYGNISLTSSSVLSQKKADTVTVPVINWSDAIQWPAIVSTKDYPVIISDSNFTSKAFALRVETEDWRIFQSNGILLIEPSLQPKHGDFVLAHEVNNPFPTIKEFLNEDESTWLRSINIPCSIEKLANVSCILGIVIEYRKIFKIINT